IVNMQGGPDLIPFIPFVAIFTALTVVASLRFCYKRFLPRLAARAIRWDLIAAGAALIVWLGLSVGRGVRYHVPPGFTLQDQDKQVGVVCEALGPDDKIYVHGSVELLVLLKKPNLNPYTFLNQGIDRFAASRRGVDLAALVDEIEMARPKVVALSRLKTVAAQDLLESWVAAHYDKLVEYAPSDVYVRKPEL